MKTSTQWEGLLSEIRAFASATDSAVFIAISQRLAVLTASVGKLELEERKAALEQIMHASALVEPVWGLMAGMALWVGGCQQSHDFLNVWNLSRYAGIQSRYSRYTGQQYIDLVDRLYGTGTAASTGMLGNCAVAFIIRGNALRQLHRYSDAESSYLHGLHGSPDNPFLKFRLVDLWLMTYQRTRANELLASLRNSYPYALEQLFSMPVPDHVAGPALTFSDVSSDNADMVWLVAADPVYIKRYGLRLVQGIAKLLSDPDNPRIKLHVHGISEKGAALPMDVLRSMGDLVPMQITKRTISLEGLTPNQRKAIFASERFLCLSELLTKYNRPLLVTDIDIESLQHPIKLFEQMKDCDIGYTRFGTVRDAWDLYPATALAFRNTPASIDFCKHLSGMIWTLLGLHPDPWFVDQVALFRLIEGGLTTAKLAYLEYLLTDTDSPKAFFRILHGSWQDDQK